MANEGQIAVDKLVRAREMIGRVCDGAIPEPIDADVGHVEVSALLKEVDRLVTVLQERTTQADASSLELALGLSDCFEALSQARKGNLAARVTEATLKSSDELLCKLGEYLNLTLQEMQDTIGRQRSVIRSLSTPILQIWDDVLALPVIGVVDTQRSSDIMESLLAAIVQNRTRYVILDITGVEVVDTKTADHFIKLISSARLLGAQCVLTGIQPAVAQTLVDIGIDLSAVTTMRNLQDGLRECLRRKEARARASSQVGGANDRTP
jgi:rsbT co-antagonist protein RsbR